MFKRVEEGRKPAKTFRELVVWQKAHDWVLGIYRYSAQFPKEETYSLVSQLRRSAVSVPANIAEGFAKMSVPDKKRHMNIAQGSLEESRYYLILSQDLDYGDSTVLMHQAEEVSKLLLSYAQSIRMSGAS